MTEPNRLDLIEMKLAHLEHTVSALNEVIARQQREIELLTAHHRHLKQLLDGLDQGGASADGFERPPHY